MRPLRSSAVVRGLVIAGLSGILGASSGEASGRIPLNGDAGLAQRARDATLELDVIAARSILKGADEIDPLLAIERGRLAIYEGDSDGAAYILGRADLAATAEGAQLGDIARGCARGMAA